MQLRRETASDANNRRQNRGLTRHARRQIDSSVTVFPYPFGRNDGVKQLIVVQDRKDHLRLDLVVKNRFDEHSLMKATERIKKLFGNEVDAEFKILDRIDRSQTGKIRNFILRSIAKP